MKAILRIWDKAISIAGRVIWLGPLLVRVGVGTMFAVSGWGHLTHFADFVEFFQGLKLPAAEFQAHLVSYTEFLGGIAIALGLATRLAAIPLASTMAVAMLSGGAFPDDEPIGVLDVLGKEEFIYMAVMLWLALVGGGKASLDAIVAKVIAAKVRPSSP